MFKWINIYHDLCSNTCNKKNDKKRQMGSVVNLINLWCFSFQPGGFDILYLLHLFCASCVSGVSKEVLYVSVTCVYFFLWYAESWPPILMCEMNPISWTIDQTLWCFFLIFFYKLRYWIIIYIYTGNMDIIYRYSSNSDNSLEKLLVSESNFV